MSEWDDFRDMGSSTPTIAPKPEPSLPLSAIRALIQQIEKIAEEMQRAGEGGIDDYYAAADCSLMLEWSKQLRDCLAPISALCPAPAAEEKARLRG